MKASEIRDMSVEEMNEKLAGLKEELFALRFQLAVNQLDNTARLKAVKKDIARIKTVLRENEIKSGVRQ
ncbi:50S ribosomal protein L29 [Porcipelethomonas ammoniilytica]|jgi:large subunit ribosomal protein L29|uniref:50S ribosomal protein L29 n=1 Tax=Porcipelethomonas TaxID=2981643 RepID=UPI000821523B|nr:50S ribosomal protein L29 [Porcipelethomonas ammoniilytica]MBS6314587.1 50S ribosomal protein L29 [Ruminococcus sp.]MEE0186010.1 50S ribosomal protein L29 [Oscillospiraceae bacterium]OLA71720.1 MAG: 50S ribosomal protein L29 [Ruminococcus sp. 37_24]SCI85953.1 50S ribosomal protein L29 [uncultured Ruminococcus sp.]MCU6719598.1 50S ribosomal protein L29 [Porcipelethomonas ammoniilytica]